MTQSYNASIDALPHRDRQCDHVRLPKCGHIVCSREINSLVQDAQRRHMLFAYHFAQSANDMVVRMLYTDKSPTISKMIHWQFPGNQSTDQFPTPEYTQAMSTLDIRPHVCLNNALSSGGSRRAHCEIPCPMCRVMSRIPLQKPSTEFNAHRLEYFPCDISSMKVYM